jgi:hypothetical protein
MGLWICLRIDGHHCQRAHGIVSHDWHRIPHGLDQVWNRKLFVLRIAKDLLD